VIPINEGNAAEVAKTVKGGAVVGPSSVRRSPSISKLAAALVAAQAEVQNPTKNKQNPHLKNWYADLTATLAAVLPVLAKHKLAVVQMPCELDDAPALTTLVIHESGEWLETTAKTRPVKTDPQNIGSAMTYARRYALQAIAGVAAEDDDDGHAASQPAKAQPSATMKPVLSERLDSAPKAEPVSAWAQTVVAKLKAAITRDVGVELWNEVEAAVKGQGVRPADKAAIDAEFKEFAKRFPKPTPTTAAKS
jgi:hypothetical protein